MESRQSSAFQNFQPRQSSQMSQLFKTSSMQSLLNRPSDIHRTFVYASNQRLQQSGAGPGLGHNDGTMFLRGSVQSLAMGTPLTQRLANAEAANAAGSVQSHAPAGRSQLEGNESLASGQNVSSQAREGVSERFSTMDLRNSSNVFALNAPVVPLSKDPRDITTKAWQDRAMNKLFELLQSRGFDWKQANRTFTWKDLAPPTLSTLTKVFEFLIGIFVGPYSLGDKSFDEEVKLYATDLGYPFVHLLKRNTLQSPNTSSSWPNVCGFLDWLREEAALWVAATSELETSPLYQMFFRGMGDDMDLEATFHRLRMQFMTSAYRRYIEGDMTAEDLHEDFKAKLHEHAGDLKEKIEVIQSQIDQGVNELRFRIDNYESLEKLTDQIKGIQQKNAATNLAIQESKKMVAEAEKDIMTGMQKITANEEKVKSLRMLLQELEEKVRSQPIKKDQYAGLLREEQDIKSDMNMRALELEDRRIKIEEEMRRKASLAEQMREISAKLRQDLAEIGDGRGALSVPDYSDQQDIDEYVAAIRAAADKTVETTQRAVDDLTRTNASIDDDFQRLERDIGKATEEEKMLQALDRELEQELLEVEAMSVGDASSNVQADQARTLKAQLQTAETEKVQLQQTLDETQNRTSHRKKSLRKMRHHLKLQEATHERFFDEFKTRQNKRIEKLDQLGDEVDQQAIKVQNGVKNLKMDLTKALTDETRELSEAALPKT